MEKKKRTTYFHCSARNFMKVFKSIPASDSSFAHRVHIIKDNWDSWIISRLVNTHSLFHYSEDLMVWTPKFYWVILQKLISFYWFPHCLLPLAVLCNSTQHVFRTSHIPLQKWHSPHWRPEKKCHPIEQQQDYSRHLHLHLAQW